MQRAQEICEGSQSVARAKTHCMVRVGSACRAALGGVADVMSPVAAK